MIPGAFFVFALAATACLCLLGAGTGGAGGLRWTPDGRHGSSLQAAQSRETLNRESLNRQAGKKWWTAGGQAPPEMTAGVASVPLILELLGTALDSGLTIQSALRVVANVSDQGIQESLRRVVAGLEIGASWHDSWEGNVARADIAQIYDALSFGALTGASAAPLLYAEAQRHRTAASRRAEKRAAALGVKLVVPLGLCSLPAFIALGIVPVVMAMIPEL